MTEPTQVVSFRLEPDTIAELRDIANTQGCTVSDLLRRGALMAMEEPNRMVVTWTVPPTVTVNASSVDVQPRTPGGEGDPMGAAISAATKALGRASIGIQETADRVLAEAAVRAAAPILRQGVADEIALAIEERDAQEATVGQDYDCPGGHECPFGNDLSEAAAIAREIGARDA